jgi:flagellar biosynthesis repressor protein FlbT
MALKMTLKPHERLIIGGAVISNGDTKAELIIENNVAILREKDIINLKDADSPCKKIYFVIQMMYVDEKNIAEHHKTYWELVKDVVQAAPSTRPMLQVISNDILLRKFYQALKAARKLIEHEEEVINLVHTTDAGIQKRRKEHNVKRSRGRGIGTH